MKAFQKLTKWRKKDDDKAAEEAKAEATTEAADDAPSTSAVVAEASQQILSPSQPPPGLLASPSGVIPPSRPTSPALVPMKGPPPPGAVMMKGPPPGAVFISQGSGQTPLRTVSPVPLSGGVPPGAKIIHGPPPPGAKIMSAPPGTATPISPSHMKMVAAVNGSPSPPVSPSHMKLLNSLPVGAKIISGPPPPGLKTMMGPPAPGAIKTLVGPPPPGAKIIQGPPPPSSTLVKVPSPMIMLGSRPVSPVAGAVAPTPLAVGTKLPPGAKVIMGPPPPGAKLMKMPVSPSRGVSPPARSPMKLQISPRRPSVGSQGATPPSTPQLLNMNQSFAQPSNSPPQAKNSPPQAANLHRPLPVRQTATAAAPPGTVPQVQSSISSSLGIPQPPNLNTDNDFDFKEEPSINSGDISFTHEEPSPRVLKDTRKHHGMNGSGADHPKRDGAMSNSSSSLFKEEEDEADLATALPPIQQAVRNKSPSSSSLQSSVVKKGGASENASSLVPPKPDKHKKRRRRHRENHHGSNGVDSPPFLGGKSAASSSSPDIVERTGHRLELKRTPSSHSHGHPLNPPSFTEEALTPIALTVQLRARIAEQFLSILCPQQYYGKVKKINGIRPLNADRSQASGLRKHNCIYVATKGVMPNQFFYPQLRLFEKDGKPTVDERDRGTYDTPIVLYEAAPGNMLFVDTELEARRVFETYPDADSCFVFSCSALIFRDPQQYALPIAMLNVRWTPYSVAVSEPQCPIHKRELQLFDPYSKELVCALCASKSDVDNSKLVVIPDVLAGDSRRRIHESISRQLEDGNRHASMWVGQHQRLTQLLKNRKDALNQQFDLLVSSIEAKRRELLEASNAEYAFAQSSIAREILISDEKVQLLTAAADHLRSDSSKPLYSMQIATIAEGIHASTEFPTSFSSSSLQIPPALSSSAVPSLEGVMTALQSVNAGNNIGGGAAEVQCRNSPFRSPQRNGRGGSITISQTPRRAVSAQALQRSALPSSHRSATMGRERLADERQSARRSAIKAPTRPRRDAPVPRVMSPSVLNASNRSDRYSASQEEGSYAVDAVSVPNSTGTSLFDYALQEILVDEPSLISPNGMSSRRLSGKPRCVQWAFRVEDPGDWVGIGVGVGTTIDVWERGRTNDLSHLWIAPNTPGRQTYLLRVTVHPTVGHAKLSIHDTRGKQLDDASIPQWNASRVCYPQVTFGGRIGQVRIIQAPHII